MRSRMRSAFSIFKHPGAPGLAVAGSNLVNATIGFEQLAALTAKPNKSLHRMLSSTGNPSMDNLAAIFHAIRERLNVNPEARSVAAGSRRESDDSPTTASPT